MVGKDIGEDMVRGVSWGGKKRRENKKKVPPPSMEMKILVSKWADVGGLCTTRSKGEKASKRLKYRIAMLRNPFLLFAPSYPRRHYTIRILYMCYCLKKHNRLFRKKKFCVGTIDPSWQRLEQHWTFKRELLAQHKKSLALLIYSRR